jgi:hypothetical protein
MKKTVGAVLVIFILALGGFLLYKDYNSGIKNKDYNIDIQTVDLNKNLTKPEETRFDLEYLRNKGIVLYKPTLIANINKYQAEELAAKVYNSPGSHTIVFSAEYWDVVSDNKKTPTWLVGFKLTNQLRRGPSGDSYICIQCHSRNLSYFKIHPSNIALINANTGETLKLLY